MDSNISRQELDELKSEFISLVSHELCAPLTNISGGIELLLAGDHGLNASARETLELVQGQISRLSRFVEAILDISALDAGRLPIYPAPVSLQAVTRQLQREMTQISGAERIQWQIPADLPALLSDEIALNSVLFHMLDNALKYAPEGCISVSAQVQGSEVCLQVSDEGAGISPEAQLNLFDRFYRANSGDAQSVYGHGLGLYMVRRLVEAMDGRVEVANHLPHGAVFSCWLPLVKDIEENHGL
jgi:signal transduction histidine kinase